MQKLSMIRKKALVAVIPLFVISGTDAAVPLDRTRAASGGSEKSMMLGIFNDNKQLPYLAQAWIGNENQGETITGPVITTPPVQRLESDAKGTIRLNTTPDTGKLLQDREPLLRFNLREIPPKSEKVNVLQIALQTKIKSFYRPAAIKTRPSEAWQNQLILNKVSGRHRVGDPTPYYVIVINLGGSEKQAEEGGSETAILFPCSEQTVKSTNYSTPYLSYINDYGGRPVLSFICNGNRCSVKKEK